MKKLKRIVASLLAVLMLLGVTPVTALAGEIELHHINTTQQPAEEPAQEPVLGSEDVLPEEDVAEAAEPAAVSSSEFYRIVHLDCGRKYFSVENIKKLIDTAAQYGYNQVQLAFGNGGCRFLLDDMELSFDGVTMSSDTVKTNITNGNYSFNGDNRYLTQSDMDTIIAYAKTKGIEIVPMLNMPGHATAIVYNTRYASNGNLDVTNETARNYGYALLAKYVEYFKNQGCKFFHFGSDESGYTGTNMTTFLTGCAKVITDAGMTPRAFNDATNVATMPTGVQITYWHLENGSKSASALANAGYSMINTHGRWYYVIKTAQNSEIGTKYWQGTVNTTATSVELPVMKAEKMDRRWVGLDEYFDGNPGYGSTVSGSKGVMFCIWCDASQDSYLTDSDVISENENYGALYQIEKLAEHYWPEDINAGSTDKPIVKLENGNDVPAYIKKGEEIVLKADKSVTWTTSNPEVIDLVSLKRNATVTADSVTAVAKSIGSATITATDETNAFSSYTINVKAADGSEVVEIKVGESRTFDAGSAAVGEYITNNDKYIATANVVKGEAQAAELKAVTAIESGKTYLIYNNRYRAVLTTNTSTAWGYPAYVGLALNGNATLNNASDLNKWVITGADGSYTVKAATGYLAIGTNTADTTATATTITLAYNATGGYWNISSADGHYLNNLGETAQAGGWKDNSAPTDAGSRWTLYEIVEASTGGNTLTISGVGEGNTEVIVGGVKYTIKVTAPETPENKVLAYGGSFSLPEGAEATIASGSEYVTISNGKVTAGQTDGTAVVNAVTKNAGGKVTAKYVYTVTVSKVDLSNVTPLPVELWVTNRYVGGTHNGTTYAATAAGHIVSVSAESAYGEDGVLLESLVPNTGADEKDLPLLYWKGVRLDSGNKQTYTGDDKSGLGSDFLKIRYFNDAWQYYSNNTWTSVLSTDQIIAYYMQVYDTSPEIKTAFRDYGGIAGDGGGEYNANWFDGYYGLGTAVVYTDKTMSPDGDKGIWNNTLRCLYVSAAGGHTPGIVKVFDTEDFTITKITITKGVHKDSTGATGANATKTWNRTTSSVLWDKKINDAGAEWYDETVIWTAEGHTPGETITLDDSIWGDTWKSSGIGEAHLLLFYVEPVEKEDNLEVVYWDDNANTRINPNEIKISVKDGVTFINGINQTSPVNAGTFTLDDNATIENSVGTSQKFNKNITIIEGVAANYRSGIYEYVGADISADGKTLTLHYNLKAVTSIHEYVVDFGLPVKFIDLLSWFNVTDVSTVDYLSVAEHNKLTESTGSWGSIKIDESTWGSMTYTLDKMLSAAAFIPLYCNLKNGTQLETQIKVIPATTVYYEDGFAKFTSGSGAANGAIWAVDGTEGTAEQALEVLGEKKNLYGYDPAYNNSTTFSMGSAKKVTVTAEMAANWNNSTDSAWPTATFTFKGTGFDVISLTDNNSGTVIYKVEDVKTNEVKYNKIVNNYYGYTYNNDNGKWEATPTEINNALYQIPVIAVRGLDYSEYKVTLTVGYGEFFDKTGDHEYSFWLDAIRIYDPMGVDNETYKGDNEGFPQYIKLRDAVKAGATEALFIDGAASADVATYANFGPNNEVYLANGQAISFKLAGDLNNIASVQIGAKAPNGNADLKVNTATGETIATATEMYYDITEAAKNGGQVTITNNTGNILSLTNLKITYSAKGSVSLAAMSAEEQTSAVMMVRAMFAPPAPTVFEPETFTVKLSNYRDVYVREYIKVTVTTSDDVKYITVGDKRISRYDDERVWGGFRKGFVKTGKRIWSYYVSFDTAGQQVISVVAYDADGLASEAVENTVNIKPRSAWRGKKSEWHI